MTMRPAIEVLADALARLTRGAPGIATPRGGMALSFADVRLVAGMLESGWDAELMQTVQECLVAGRGDAGSDSLSPAPRT